MTRLGRIVLVAVLAWTLVPGLGEAVENVWHVLIEGHSAHAQPSAGETHTPFDSEHGCTGTFHLCRCHASPHLSLTTPVSLSTSALAFATRMDESGRLADGTRPGIEHPPRA